MESGLDKRLEKLIETVVEETVNETVDATIKKVKELLISIRDTNEGLLIKDMTPYQVITFIIDNIYIKKDENI